MYRACILILSWVKNRVQQLVEHYVQRHSESQSQQATSRSSAIQFYVNVPKNKQHHIANRMAQ